MSDEILDKNYRVSKDNAIDMHVGKRIRLRRTLLRIFQEHLGVALNITFEQVQKSVCGTERVRASRLLDTSQIFHVLIGLFFTGLSDDVIKSSPRHISRNVNHKNSECAVRDLMARRDTLELLHTHNPIAPLKVLKRITEIVKSIAVTINEKWIYYKWKRLSFA